MSWGNMLENNMPLDQFGAPGFTFRERVDFSGPMGHGRDVTPHVNAEVLNPFQATIRRDLANNQLPGFNGMQFPGGY